ncbi:MAG: trypsin-like peptidase domain-containing protein [Microcystis aeruginosa G13-12]|nr:trypsin-like peptidase domain-containing protein [Microcystis aeruginosa SX13-11]NCR67823.1 trypsin-like peptidase domain-containing protein [Microcystis aeruginosa LL11-07]NCS16780.1 trypsin-like peptidase domain-containing protein [Microcystis aeruginosa G13-12]NCS20436.1 trypsin-like peptidase domain-containing protein [Microcystis aeruginosa G11-06]NCS35712.1 trypsin-like peptidase domain-containing protein [Microcystis aeruginosa G11-01]NCT51945.1 trypsin-like peptidase domain-containi
MTYLLTCAHVIEDVGGLEQVEAGGLPAIVVVSGEEDNIDLVVLRVDGLRDKPPLNLQVWGEKGSPFMTAGFQLFGGNLLIRPLRGKLGDQVGLQSRQSGDRIQAWDLQILDDYALQPGYSGSPVVNEESGNVLAVVSHRQGEGKSGLAISIDSLSRIWRVPDSKQTYHNLLKLGYREQARLFRRVINAHDVAAFLIHGSLGYGQRWLLNRLVVQHLPLWVTGKVVKIDVSRRVRKSNASALWRELGERVGLRGRQFSLEEIAEGVYKWWRTQDVLLIFHDVDFMPESAFHELIQDFWLSLATRAKESLKEECQFKLLMFLVDYEGCVANWNVPFVEKMDASWKPDKPIKAPKIHEFSDKELTEWIEDQYSDLPTKLTQEIDEAVETILENSARGIPEEVLREICDQCGLDWYEESESWLKL